MSNRGRALLVFMPAVPVWLDREGNYLFDRKYYDGLLLMQSLWGGGLRCVMTLGRDSLPTFGIISRPSVSLPFDILTVNSGMEIGENHIEGATIVQAAGDVWDQTHVSELCNRRGIPCIYTIEYTPDTRLRMLCIDTTNPLLRLRRWFFLERTERRRRRAFALAAGLQANGVPAAKYYCDICPSTLTYFDTRVSAVDVVKNAQLTKRLDGLMSGGQLRIVFSGRLAAIKGVDHLIGVAVHLREAGINFRLDIFGSGELEQVLRIDIKKYCLDGIVCLHGAVDFERELLPVLREKTDLALLLHRQGDPSCTYAETLSAGVPIVGYANEAFLGMLEEGDFGWSTPLDDISSVVQTVIRLESDRSEIARASREAASFAEKNTFEEVFLRRDLHLKSILHG